MKLEGEVLAKLLDENAYLCWVNSRRNAMARNSEKEVELFDEPLGKLLVALDETTEICGTVDEFNGQKYLNLMKWKWVEREKGWKRVKGFGIPASKAKKFAATLDAWVNRK